MFQSFYGMVITDGRKCEAEPIRHWSYFDEIHYLYLAINTSRIYIEVPTNNAIVWGEDLIS